MSQGPDKAEGSKKLWGGRYTADPAALFDRLHASIPFDYVLAPFDIKGSRAHVRMLERIGVLTAAERDQILGGLGPDRAARWSRAPASGSCPTRTSTWPSSGALTEIIGPVAGKMHTGRSRNDQVILDLHLYLMDAVEGHQRRIAGLMSALLGAGREGQDHGHARLHAPAAGPAGAAGPPSAGLLLRAGAGVAALRRLAARPADAPGRGRPGWGQLPPRQGVGGGGAGFRAGGPQRHGRGGCARCAVRLSGGGHQLRADLVAVWPGRSCCGRTAEFGLAALPDTWTSGSSIMPQKRNPDGAELVRAKASGFLARLQGLGGVIKGSAAGLQQRPAGGQALRLRQSR